MVVSWSACALKKTYKMLVFSQRMKVFVPLSSEIGATRVLGIMYLNPSMATEVEIKLGGMANLGVNHGSCKHRQENEDQTQ
jgi:hypothetical protein